MSAIDPKPARGNPPELTLQEFRELGKMLFAYVRPAVSDGAPGWAIHAADGEAIGFATDRDAALGAIIQHGMEPVSLH